MSKTAEAHPIVRELKVRDALDHARAVAQELHGALTDAVAKRGGVIKGDLESVTHDTKVIADSIRSSLGAQNAATKRYIEEAVTHLEATAAHATEALKSSGRAAETSIQQAISTARAAVQKISEAVAAKRSAASKPQMRK